jgi:hypothetical protein
MRNRGIYKGPPTPTHTRTPAICQYISQLTREHMVLYSSVNRGIYKGPPCFGCIPGWGASKIGHAAEIVYNNHTRHKSTKIHSLRTTIHSLHTKICIVLTQRHMTYNSIMALHRCRCHNPRPHRILPCLGPCR